MTANDEARLGRIRAAFTQQAGTFDAHAETADLSVEDRFVRALGEHAAGRILDVACGPGVVTAAVAHRAEAVIGLDATEAMLGKAAARTSGLPNVSLKAGDAENLPFADGEFDAVVTRLSLHHFERPGRALSEMARVLRPGGRAVIVDVSSDDDPEKSALQNAIETLRDPSHVRMMPAAEIERLILDQGFSIALRENWVKDREFGEWMGIANDPKLLDPLSTVVRTLARAGCDAGFGLHLDGAAIRFFHRWHLFAADHP